MWGTVIRPRSGTRELPRRFDKCFLKSRETAETRGKEMCTPERNCKTATRAISRPTKLMKPEMVESQATAAKFRKHSLRENYEATALHFLVPASLCLGEFRPLNNEIQNRIGSNSKIPRLVLRELGLPGIV